MPNLRRVAAACCLLLPAILLPACTTTQKPEPDRPLLTANVVLKDVIFRSGSLGRDMPYRVILPAAATPQKLLPVIYLLHGGDGGYRDWSNYSDVARYAESGFLLVMPEGESSYYTNAVGPPTDRYEDYIVHDLIADVESRFPAAPGRANRAIIGLSMGGFGAVTLGLKHPELFTFAGGLSPALDVTRRSFVFKRFHQSRHYAAIFGPAGSPTRQASDPFVLVRAADPEKAPYFFLTCGEQEGLLPANREFAALLAHQHFRYEFHTIPGGHNWSQWDAWLPALFRSLSEHMPPVPIR